MNILNVNYWINCNSKLEIKLKIKKNISLIKSNKKLCEEFLLLILYIRDKQYGLGNKTISRWMLIELEYYYIGITESILINLYKFGYWKDLNLILIDINGIPPLKHLEDNIFNIIKVQFKKDIYNYETYKYDNISSLVKYIGKERKSLDRQTGFTKKFVSYLYPNLELLEALKKFRCICKKINKIIIKEKNNFNNNMINFKKNPILEFNDIKNSLYKYPKYWDTKQRFSKFYIKSEKDLINNINTKYNGNYLFTDNLLNNINLEPNYLSNINIDISNKIIDNLDYNYLFNDNYKFNDNLYNKSIVNLYPNNNIYLDLSKKDNIFQNKFHYLSNKLVLYENKKILKNTINLFTNKKNKEIINKDKEIINKDKEIINKDKEIINKYKEIINKDKEIINKDNEITNKDKKIANKDKEIINKDKKIINKEIINKEIINKDKEIINKDKEITNKEIINKDKEITNKDKEIINITENKSWYNYLFGFENKIENRENINDNFIIISNKDIL